MSDHAAGLVSCSALPAARRPDPAATLLRQRQAKTASEASLRMCGRHMRHAGQETGHTGWRTRESAGEGPAGLAGPDIPPTLPIPAHHLMIISQPAFSIDQCDHLLRHALRVRLVAARRDQHPRGEPPPAEADAGGAGASGRGRRRSPRRPWPRGRAVHHQPRRVRRRLDVSRHAAPRLAACAAEEPIHAAGVVVSLEVTPVHISSGLQL